MSWCGVSMAHGGWWRASKAFGWSHYREVMAIYFLGRCECLNKINGMWILIHLLTFLQTLWSGYLEQLIVPLRGCRLSLSGLQMHSISLTEFHGHQCIGSMGTLRGHPSWRYRNSWQLCHVEISWNYILGPCVQLRSNCYIYYVIGHKQE